MRPSEARKKPKVAAFQTAHVERILALRPDIVLGFSDLQAGIAAELIGAGVTVLITNQRTLAETYEAIALVGAAVGETEAGLRVADVLRIAVERLAGSPHGRRPRIYFEEWDDPMISGIAWVSELIEAAGGEDIFAELRSRGRAAERCVNTEQLLARDPEIVIASWCGKKARLEKIRARPGWDVVSAVRNGQLYEIKAPDILQPGPSLVHGARQLSGIIEGWKAGDTKPGEPTYLATGPGSTAK